MSTGLPAIDAVIARIAEADKKAEASGVAWVLGPDAFAAHIKKTYEARLEELTREPVADGGSEQEVRGSGAGS